MSQFGKRGTENAGSDDDTPSTVFNAIKRPILILYAVLALLLAGIIAIPIQKRDQDSRTTRALHIMGSPKVSDADFKDALEYLNSRQYCIPVADWCLKERYRFLKTHIGIEQARKMKELRGIDLSNANFYWAQMSAIDLRGSIFKNAKIERMTVINTNFSGANLSNAAFFGSTFHGASFRGADLRSASLLYTVFENSDFSNADLTAADLSRARIVWDSRNSRKSPYRLKFTDALLADTNISGIRFDKSTRICSARIVNVWAWSSDLPSDMPSCISRKLVTYEAGEKLKNKKVHEESGNTGTPDLSLMLPE